MATLPGAASQQASDGRLCMLPPWLHTPSLPSNANNSGLCRYHHLMATLHGASSQQALDAHAAALTAHVARYGNTSGALASRLMELNRTLYD